MLFQPATRDVVDGAQCVLGAQVTVVVAGAVHPQSPSGSAPRMSRSACRVHDFTVPSGCLRRAAISLCDNPCQYASSSTARWCGSSFSNARRTASREDEVSAELADATAAGASALA